MDIKNKVSVCATYIGTRYPFFSFNFIKQEYIISNQEYRYCTHGEWFAVICAIIPLIWADCPFSWAFGLTAGLTFTLCFNVITYLLFQKKVINAANEDESSKGMSFSPEKNYYVAKNMAELLTVISNGKHYICVSESEEELRRFINEEDAAPSFTPTKQHIHTIVCHAKELNVGICLIVDGKECFFEYKHVLRNKVPDMLEELLYRQTVFYATVYKLGEQSVYYTANNGRLVIQLSPNDAHIYAKKYIGDYEVRTMILAEIRKVVERINGLCIVDRDGMILYNEPSGIVLSVLSNYI